MNNKNPRKFQKKSLGQNFLVNKGVLTHIINAANIVPGETVLEIGPGKGTLTEALLHAGANVITIEKDDRLIPILKEKFGDELQTKTLTLIHADFLETDLEKTIPLGSYKVVANIPYYITGSLIRFLLSSSCLPESMVLMLQKEVAKRIVAKDGKESLLSLSIKAYGSPHYIKTVSRGSFSPPPGVDSAILKVENISKKFFEDFSEELFFSVIRAGFAQKRKKLLRNLEEKFEKKLIEKAFTHCNIPLLSRSEDLTLENWHCLTKCLGNQN